MEPRPSHWRRNTLIAFGLLVVLVVGAVLTLRQMFPPARLAELVAAKVQGTTGRDFAIRGPLSLRVWPDIAVVAEDVRLANVAWGTRADMLTVREAAFEVALRPLLGGELVIQRVAIAGADLWLETDTAGRGNWAFTPAKPAPSAAEAGASQAGQGLTAVTLGALELSDVHVTVRSARLQGERVLQIAKLALQARGPNYTLAATLDFGGPAWTIDGELGGLAALQADATDWPLDLKLASVGAKASVKGTLALGAQAGDMRLAFSAALQNAQALQPWVPADLPLPWPVTVAATMQRQRGAMKIAPLEFSLAGQTLRGEVQEPGRNPPQVTARLSATSIDFSALKGPPHATGGAAAPSAARPPGQLFSRKPWVLPALPPWSLDLVLDIGSLKAPGLPAVTGLKLPVKLEAGGVTLGPTRFNVAQGQVDGSARVDLAKGAAPRLRLQLDARNLSVDVVAAVIHPQGTPLHGGRVQAALDLTASGESEHAMAASAQGQVLVSARDMVLSGQAGAIGSGPFISLLRAVTPGQSVARDSAVRCAVMRLPLQRGVAEIDQSIAMESEQVTASAVGRLDLGAETIALALRPTTRGGIGISAANLSGLVRVDGALLNPKISLDAAGALREAANVGTVVATAGLSVLAERVLRKTKVVETVSPCQRALGAKR